MIIPNDCWKILLSFSPIRSVSTLGLGNRELAGLARQHAQRVSTEEVDGELGAFFPCKSLSDVQRAWFAEKPTRLHHISRKRWKRLAEPEKRESEATKNTRLASLATRIHRLRCAIDGGDLSRTKAMFAAGINLNERLSSYGFRGGETPFQKACVAGKSSLVLWMLSRGASPTARDSSGRTASQLVNIAINKIRSSNVPSSGLRAAELASVGILLDEASGTPRPRDTAPNSTSVQRALALALQRRPSKMVPAVRADPSHGTRSSSQSNWAEFEEKERREKRRRLSSRFATQTLIGGPGAAPLLAAWQGLGLQGP